VTFVPVRYADDFIILVHVPPGPRQEERAYEAAQREKAALAELLRETLGLELSESKTLITAVTKPMRFLGHHVRVQHHRLYGWLSNNVIPKDRTRQLRETIKQLLGRSSCNQTLASRLKLLNPILRGWGNYYRHARGAKQIFNDLDRYVWWAIRRWIRRKHQGVGMRKLNDRYGWRKPGRRSVKWRDGSIVPYELMQLRVERFKYSTLRSPAFTRITYGEPGA
jgi:hypothetical protein